MDELAEKLASLLGSDGIQKLQGMLRGLGSSNPAPPAEPAPAGNLPDLGMLASLLGGAQGGGQSSASGNAAPDLGALSAMLGALQGSGNPTAQNPSGNPLASLDPALLARLGSAFSSFGQDNEDTRLLLALRPHLKEARRHRVDEAVNMMRVLSLLPVLRETGLLPAVLGGKSA